MKIFAGVKLVIGVILLLGVLNGIKGIVNVANAAQASGYLMAMTLFALIGGFLVYSGIKGLSNSVPK